MAKIMQGAGSPGKTDPAPSRNRLTPRQVQCLEFAAEGKKGEEIAELMNISIPTVRFHLSRATKRLRAANVCAAIYLAAKADII